MINFCQGARLLEKAVMGSMHLTKLNKMGASNATTKNPPMMRIIPAKIHRMETEIHVKTPRRMAARPSITVPILMAH